MGWKDEELSELGHKQAKEASKRINIKFNRIISSPLKRCKQTAAYFGEFQIDDRLIELNFGIFEGKSYLEIEKEFKEEYNTWCEDYKNYRIPKGESLMDLLIGLTIF
ncbi:histidine phosphatase family protein [Caloramator sp. mosi_1]|uniref:histidine phosphatase family protein n=1 Tax=Caloramator sp. mosi_1 TaxID=3023090 RepID=UPI0023604733|nr:histidine phosphatase family protein [Caloramator sp. mosi_1]WDC85622.1 histidine phosphatase family protein [Caloramator sp. mosi_1]